MAIYLNTIKPIENYKRLINTKYFVDKYMIIEKTNELINTTNNYLCVTRPRRFGKSSVADMLGSYYSKAVDSKEVFESLKISKADGYEEHLNKYNVINISFNTIPDKNKTYDDYIGFIQSGLVDDIKNMYPTLEIKNYFNISNMLSATNEKFIFIFDEWDYIFNNNLYVENQNDFLEFFALRTFGEEIC
ncbi:Predicted AAA-ATPase [Clostridium gasigenes]|uniref:Predicted AAA-ATPase n=1 Tax=Clostridium gasigenes TaxID=94869 RepID=A0A1H0VKY7_9CLOT|nr:Predicted AAA-ATPase [Clostridium gasigenes]